MTTIDVGVKTDLGLKWLHVDGQVVKCYGTLFFARMRAKKLAKLMKLTKLDEPRKPYDYGCGKMIPIHSWSDE